MFADTRLAMNVSTSGSVIAIRSVSTRLRRIAMRVSRIGGLDVGEKPPLEPRAEAFLQRRDLARRPVGRDDDLRAALVQRVEGVEELLLDPLLALDELDVVDEEDVASCGSAA